MEFAKRFLNKKQKICNESIASLGLGERLTDELIKEACSMAMDAHKSAKEAYLHKNYDSLSRVIFSFPGFWSVNDWYTGNPFGKKKIEKEFPSLKSIATEEVATVNEAFLKKFEVILPKIQQKVEKYVKEGKKIVFTGHSSGGPIAVLVTVWFLQEELKKPNPKDRLSHLCITFGSPLVGDHIFNHALGRENWSHYFTHFITRYDIIPRVLLAPLSSIEQLLNSVLHFLKPNSTRLKQEPSDEASTLYETVMRNVSSLASDAACQLMRNTYNLSEALSTFIDLSPYRPSGTYIFCTGNEELVVVENPDAVLQILFYSCLLNSAQEVSEIAMRSIKHHQIYQRELESIEKKKVIQLDLARLQSSSDVGDVTIEMVLNNLGLSTRARLCLCAAREFKKKKLENQKNIEDYRQKIEDGITKLEQYKTSCEKGKVCYYDAFKISRGTADFDANIERLRLAGIFDELMEMIKKYELPDGFEGIEYWIKIGTRYRCLVEPLDIANYYRHLKNADAGSYMIKGRPKRYRFTQKWLEYAERKEIGCSLESCFWAEVEELDVCLKSNEELSNDVKGKISCLEKKAEDWFKRGELGHDVFFKNSTFDELCKTLHRKYGLESFSEVKKQVEELSKKCD